MAKPKTIYRCTECGYESAKWNGKCPSCGAWNTLEEDVPLPAQAVGNSRRKPVDLSDKIQELDEVDTTADVRYHTGVGELDRVLGGGLVRGSIVLLGGEPGIGKMHAAVANLPVFRRISQRAVCLRRGICQADQARAQRLGVTTRSLYLLTVTDAQSICDTISASRPDIVIIDSIQTMRMGRDLFQPRQSDTGAGVYQSVYAHRKTAGYPHLDRGTREQGRCDCRAKGHGAHCGYRAVF